MAKTQPIAPETQDSEDVAARKLLAVRATATSRPAPPKSGPGNGSTSIGGRQVQGGARVRGGRA